LMGPEPAVLRGRSQAMARTQKQQDVGGLADEAASCLQKRRSERQVVAPHVPSGCTLAVPDAHHRRHSAGGTSNVDVARSGLLEGESHELSSSGDARPVIKVVGHGLLRGSASAGTRGGWIAFYNAVNDP